MKKLTVTLLSLILSASLFAQERKTFDFIVPDNGDFKAAIAKANSRKDQSKRFRIFIKQGNYIIPASETSTVKGMDDVEYPDPRTDLTASNVSIIGEGMEITTLTNTPPTNVIEGQWGPACPIEGLRKCYTLKNSGTDNYIQDVKLVNGMKDHTGRGEALEDNGNKTICKNVGLWGYQDTYCSNNGNSRMYFEGGVIRGRTDYICGKDDIFFQGVEFRNVDAGGYIAVPSRPKQFGYVMRDCIITAEDPEKCDQNYTLGRPWGQGTPIALWINTKCNVIPKAIGWADMSGGWPAQYAEYGSVDKNGKALDLSGRKYSWTDKEGNIHPNKPVLSKKEAADYTVEKVLGGDDNWNPQALTKSVAKPTNLMRNGKTLTWDDNPEALCWAICIDGKVLCFTAKNSFKIKAEGNYSVKAVSQMGGLSDAQEF